MRNLYKYAVMSIMLICTSTVYGATVRDNYVYFPGVKDFQWHQSSHKITVGQPWESIHYGISDGSGVIHIRAGRKGSEVVANWFKDRIGNAIATRDDHPLGRPDKLNFATYGHMNLWDHHGRMAQCRNIVIGQGHTAAGYNNWWIGSRDLREYGGKYWLVCPRLNTICGAVIPIDPSFNHSDIFSLDVWVCPPAVSVSLSSDELWPPNGKMHEIEATITGHDVCGPNYVVNLISVESSEPESGTGSGGIEDDIQDHEIDTDDRVFRLRAERSNDGDGRVYTVIYYIMDECGTETTVEATVTVPKDMGKNKRLQKSTNTAVELEGAGKKR